MSFDPRNPKELAKKLSGLGALVRTFNEDPLKFANAPAPSATCSKCKRPLKHPESVRRGMGPECAGVSYTKSKKGRKVIAENEDQMALGLEGEPLLISLSDVILARPNGIASANVAHHWVAHSPTGFEWGYSGSGPADLALNILLRFGLSRDTAWLLHQDFKREFIAPMPEMGGVISAQQIVAWVFRRLETRGD